MDLLLGLGIATLLVAVVAAIGYTTNQEVSGIFDRTERDAREIAVDNGTRFAQLLANNTATTVRPSVIDNNFSSLREVLESMTAKDEALLYIAVLDGDGKTIASSGARPSAETSVLEAAAPITSRGDALGGVELVYGMAAVESRIEAARKQRHERRASAIRSLIVEGAVTLGLGLLMAVGFGLWLTRPVTRLAEAAEELGRGQFDARVGVGGPREIRQLASTFNSMAGQLEESVAASIERAAVDREVELAHELQKQMMPPEGRIDLGQLEIVSWYQPAGTCAGDWWIVDDSTESVTVMVGDVIGHGIPAALFTAAAQSAYRTAGALGADVGAAEILGTIDAGLHGFDQARTMSCCALVIDRASGAVSLSIGGHPSPLHIRGDDDGDGIEILESHSGPLLGDPESDDVFTSSAHQMSPGDILVLYTDGVIEAVNDKGRMFGLRRLGRPFADNRERDLERTLAALQDAFRKYVGDVEVDDDVTVVVIRYLGSVGE